MTEADLLDLTEEAISRCWVGIHYSVDNDAAIFLGRKVDYLVADVAQNDGAI